MLERGPEEEVRLGLWMLLGGVSRELEGRDGRTQEGVTPHRGRLRPSRPFLSLSWRKGGSPRPPLWLPSHPASSSPSSGEGGAEGRLDSKRNLSTVCAPALRLRSER